MPVSDQSTNRGTVIVSSQELLDLVLVSAIIVDFGKSQTFELAPQLDQRFRRDAMLPSSWAFANHDVNRVSTQF